LPIHLMNGCVTRCAVDGVADAGIVLRSIPVCGSIYFIAGSEIYKTILYNLIYEMSKQIAGPATYFIVSAPANRWMTCIGSTARRESGRRMKPWQAHR
jgi:hypothetical protein